MPSTKKIESQPAEKSYKTDEVEGKIEMKQKKGRVLQFPAFAARQLDMSELKEYASTVEDYAANRKELIFPNSDCYHSAIVLSKIVQHSEHRIRIYDDALNGDISGEYDVFGTFIPSLKTFLDRDNTSLEIVVRSAGDEDTEIFSLLKNHIVENNALRKENKSLRNISVRLASGSFQAKVKQVFRKDHNFAVGDSNAFRLEEYVEDVFIRKAICSFNNDIYPKAINKVFDEEFGGCEVVF